MEAGNRVSRPEAQGRNNLAVKSTLRTSANPDVLDQSRVHDIDTYRQRAITGDQQTFSVDRKHRTVESNKNLPTLVLLPIRNSRTG
jgi:hypothetical protein